MPTNYLSQLRNPRLQSSPELPSPTGYLALLQRPAPRSPRPSRTLFARAYASLLPQRHLFAALGPTTGKSRRLFYDGRDINASVLVELCELCAHDGVPVGIDIVRRVAEALACPAADPYKERLRAWLANAAAAALLSPTDSGDLARITLDAVPHWFVSMRDVKAELDAYGSANVRRLRAAMKSLGWRERRAIAWGRRTLGFVRPVQTANM